MVDGTTAIVYLIGSLTSRPKTRERWRNSEITFWPVVTIIIPVYNGKATLGVCLESVRAQNYPQEKVEIIVVNNQSTDDSFRIFAAEQERPFGGKMSWVDTVERGKAWALNAGIHLASGIYVINIDCDTILHPDAVLRMVQAFEAEPEMGAATGAIEVMRVDQGKLKPMRRIWAECEALEYLMAFRIGREHQSSKNSLYTIAGAFSAFRRDVLMRSFLYDRQSVSEDTKLTYDIREKFVPKEMRIGYVGDAVAYVDPTLSWSRMYSQRVRWQRGQLEVIALFPLISVLSMFKTNGLSSARILMIDHTMAFPRLAWNFVLPMLYFMGYSLPLVVAATIAMFLCYITIEALSQLTCYVLGNGDGKERIKEHWWIFVFMPIYRFNIFWFRLAGFLNAITETPEWQVFDPLAQTSQGMAKSFTKARRFISGLNSKE